MFHSYVFTITEFVICTKKPMKSQQSTLALRKRAVYVNDD